MTNCDGAIVCRTEEGARRYMERVGLRVDRYEILWCKRHRGYHVYYKGGFDG